MKITDKCVANPDKLITICDYSPPRAATANYLDPAREVEADYICVAYNPGRRVRVDAAMFAAAIKQHTERDVIFNLSPRDMNKLALQSHLLGAQMLGLDNVLVVQGDNFSEKDLALVSQVSDYKATELMQAIAQMNQGLDYKETNLKTPTDLCIGASIDLGRGIEREAALTHRKVQAGADYFITQPIFDPAEITAFEEAYTAVANTPLSQPIFYGLQILIKDGIIFSNVPQQIRDDLEKGRDGTELALEQLEKLQEAGVRTIYLVSPILRGGARDYTAAQRVIAGA